MSNHLVEHKNADYLLTIKGNRPSLLTAAIAAGRKLITTAPGHVSEERGHGRINRWNTWAAGTDDGIVLPYAAGLAVIRRDVTDLACTDVILGTRAAEYTG